MSRGVVPLVLLLALPVAAQTVAQASVAGRWEGVLVADAANMRLVIDITRASDGLLLGMIANLDHGVRLPINRIEERSNSIHLEVNAIRGSYDGVLSSDGNRIIGTWTQGTPTPLELRRSASASEPSRADEKRAESGDPFGVPVEMKVPMPPTPFPGNGSLHLVYELHITNFADEELLIRKLEVLSGESVVMAFEGVQLNMMLQRPGASNVLDRRALGRGQRAIAYMWLSADVGTKMPASLRHRVTGRTESVEGGLVRVSLTPPIVLGPPLRGSNWLAANGPDNTSGHRRALTLVDGSASIAQRFAIDWLQVGPDGNTFTGNPTDNNSYRAQGQELLAVADGTVVSVKDGIPDNVPRAASRAVPITPETIAGNVIVLDVGGGRFAFYGHVQRGSLRVKSGDKVRRGQVLGLVGNSGNSDEPHLHFHVADSASLLVSEGLPYVIDSFETMTSPSAWQRRRNELPMDGTVVRFSVSQ